MVLKLNDSNILVFFEFLGEFLYQISLLIIRFLINIWSCSRYLINLYNTFVEVYGGSIDNLKDINNENIFWYFLTIPRFINGYSYYVITNGRCISNQRSILNRGPIHPSIDTIKAESRFCVKAKARHSIIV